MILEVRKDEYEKLAFIKEQVGEAIKIGFKKHIFSSNFKATRVSEDLYLSLPTQSNYYNINLEIRPKGLIVHFKYNGKHLQWPISFFKLAIYQSKYISIYEGNTCIRFDKEGLSAQDFDFIKQIQKQKSKFIDSFQHPF